MENVRPIDILLVEDNPGDARLTAEALRNAKVHNCVRWVTNGEEAIAALRQQGKYAGDSLPDLILLDLNLPRKDGREVLAEIKGDARLKRIPIVVLTTSEAEEDIARAYHLNANCYITKPMRLDEFMEVIRCIEAFWSTVVRLPDNE